MTAGKTTAEAGSFVAGLKMVLTVTLVAALSAGLLGFVFDATKDRIASSQRAEKATAFDTILPAFDNQPLDERAEVALHEGDGKTAVLYTARQGGSPVGYAVEMETSAFDTGIILLVGATPEGQVTGVYILAHKETPGLGAKATKDQDKWPAWRKECAASDDGQACRGKNDPFLRQFVHRRVDERFRVSKAGGDIESITASTITSEGIAKAVVQAVQTIVAHHAGGQGGDS